jgi:hypothetical protein
MFCAFSIRIFFPQLFPTPIRYPLYANMVGQPLQLHHKKYFLYRVFYEFSISGGERGRQGGGRNKKSERLLFFVALIIRSDNFDYSFIFNYN